jgi:hypothetical protein
MLAIGALAYGAHRWSQAGPRDPDVPEPRLDPDLERRVDEELASFDG